MAINSVGTSSYSNTYTASSTKSSGTKNTNTVQSAGETEQETKSTASVATGYSDDKVDYSQGLVEEAKSIQYSRDKVNESLNTVFKENGIEIPKGTTLTFTIEPYDYKLTVSGLEDSDLTSRIESVLNSGRNSTNLFCNICISSVGDNITSDQYTSEKANKSNLFALVKENTGYDLRDCVSKDGTFYAPDGTDVIQEFMKGRDIPAQCRSKVTSYYEPRLRELAQEGFENSADLVLQIDYKDGDLYDVGQTNGFGPGQTQWIDDLVSKYGDDVWVKPVDEVNIDPKTPEISDLLKKNGIDLSKVASLKFTFNTKGNYMSITGTDDTELLWNLQHLFFQPSTKSLLQYICQTQTQSSNHLDVSV